MQTQRIRTGALIKRIILPAIIIISLFIILTEDNLFEMNTARSSFLTFVVFLVVCVCIYCAVLTFFSFISGWRIMSRRLPAPETFQSDSVLFSSQSLKMGYMDYSMSVNIRFTDTGLVFSQSRFFSFMHDPFIIPYEKNR